MKLSKKILALVERLYYRCRIAQEHPTRKNLEAILDLGDALCESPEGCEVWRRIQGE